MSPQKLEKISLHAGNIALKNVADFAVSKLIAALSCVDAAQRNLVLTGCRKQLSTAIANAHAPQAFPELDPVESDHLAAELSEALRREYQSVLSRLSSINL